MKRLLPMVLLVAGCTQLPPSPEDIQAKKFEAPADKAVIYVVRTPMDSRETSPVRVGDRQAATHGGTYYRWEVAPGSHRVAGFGAPSDAVTLSTAAGRIYFVEHTVIGDPDDGGVQSVRLRQIGDQDGRRLVTLSELAR